MGCDINGLVQVRKNGVWVTKTTGYEDRNYRLFAVLANVRNYEDITPISHPRGVPQEETDANVKKIKKTLNFKEPKKFVNKIDGIWLGEHSFSYYYADELLSFDWGTKAELSGFLEIKNYVNWDKKEEPSFVFRDYKTGFNIISRNELDALIEEIGIEGVLRKYEQNPTLIPINYKLPYREIIGEHFFDSFIEGVLRPLANEYGAENVRWIFGFDS